MRALRNKYEKLIVVSLLAVLIFLNVSWISQSASNNHQKCSSSSSPEPGKSVNENSQAVVKTWTRISSKVFIYSAYIEDRMKDSPYIQIIGIKRVKKRLDSKDTLGHHPIVQDITKVKDDRSIHLQYFCKLHYVENNEFKYVVSTNMSYFVFEEGVHLYAGTFYKCYFHWIPINTNPNSEPHGTGNWTSFPEPEILISLHPVNVTGYPDKLVPVQRKRRKFKTNLSVCVRPLFGPMDDLKKMAQFIAFYEAMGASHFTFYDLSISPRIKNYLNKLGSESISLFRWNLPTGNSSDLWDYGTLAALHDCVYQSTGLVIIVDIDEFIVHRTVHSTLLEFLMDPSYATAYDQFCFRNVFFCDELCPSPSNLNTKNSTVTSIPMINQIRNSTHVLSQIKDARGGMELDERSNFMEDKHQSSFLMSSSFLEIQKKSVLPILTCSMRTKRIWGIFNRAKYITRAEKVFSLGHHFVTTFTYSDDPRYSKFTWKVPTTTALLHHYRKCEGISSKADPIYKRVIVMDDRMTLFKTLVENTRSYKIYESSQLN